MHLIKKSSLPLWHVNVRSQRNDKMKERNWDKSKKKSRSTHLVRKAGLVVELLEVAFFGYWLALVRGKRADELPVPGLTGDTAKTHTAYASKTMAKKAFIVCDCFTSLLYFTQEFSLPYFMSLDCAIPCTVCLYMLKDQYNLSYSALLLLLLLHY